MPFFSLQMCYNLDGVNFIITIEYIPLIGGEYGS